MRHPSRRCLKRFDSDRDDPFPLGEHWLHTPKTNMMAFQVTVRVIFEYRGPTWVLDETTVEAIMSIWSSLQRGDGGVPSSPSEYQGCNVQTDDGRMWFAFGGTVTLTSANLFEVRSDPTRQFEKRLLASAPARILSRIPPFV